MLTAAEAFYLEMLSVCFFIMTGLVLADLLQNRFHKEKSKTLLLLCGFLEVVVEGGWTIAFAYLRNAEWVNDALCIVELYLPMLSAVLLCYMACKKFYAGRNFMRFFPALSILGGTGVFLGLLTNVWTRGIFRINEEYVAKWQGGYWVYFAVLCAAWLALSLFFLYKGLKLRRADPAQSRYAMAYGEVAGVFMLGMLMMNIFIDVSYAMFSLPYVLSLVYLKMKLHALEQAEEQVRQELAKADMKVSAQIQTGVLPKVFPPWPHHPEVAAYGLLETAREVGGDFFDCFELSRNRVCFLIADTSGKGIPAALFMMNARNVIRSCAEECAAPGEIFTRANHILSQGNDAHMFITAWLGILEPESGRLQFCNAGHCPPYYASRGGKFVPLKDRHGAILACMDGIRYREGEMQLQGGDRLFLYTDGLTEAHNPQNKMYTEAGVVEMLEAAGDLAPEALLRHAMHSLKQFVAGGEPFDDVTLFALQMPLDLQKGGNANV